jgi:hypothetical protein
MGQSIPELAEMLQGFAEFHGISSPMDGGSLGFIPLHGACWYGHLEVSEILAKRTKKIDTKGYLKLTPLHLAGTCASSLTMTSVELPIFLSTPHHCIYSL